MTMLDNTSPSGSFTQLYYDRARTWYGWQAKDARSWPCPLRAAGKRCASDYRCMCQSNGDLDHPRLWKDPVGQRTVYTFEPYKSVDLPALRELLAPYGLDVAEMPRSMWWPGVTWLYAVAKPTTPDLLRHHRRRGPTEPYPAAW